MAERVLAVLGLAFAAHLGLAAGSAPGERPAPLPTPDLSSPRHGVAIPRGADGLFRIEARLNGAPVRLVLDTGSSLTVLSARDAARIGLAPRTLRYNERLETGGGHVPVARSTIASATVMDRDLAGLPVMVARSYFPVSVLGQDVIARLGTVSINADILVIGAPPEEARKGANAARS